MHKYLVVERSAERGWCALICNTGHYHTAQALNFTPPMDAVLHGEKPRLGFGILVCSGSGALYRVIFDSINKHHLPRSFEARTTS